MNTETQNLMKHFASVLRGRAIGKLETPSINSGVTRYFSRKELIEIVKKRFDGSIPKEHNLLEMENVELLELIGDEMYIIAYVTEKWSKEPIQKSVSKTTPAPAKTEIRKTSQNKKKDDNKVSK